MRAEWRYPVESGESTRNSLLEILRKEMGELRGMADPRRRSDSFPVSSPEANEEQSDSGEELTREEIDAIAATMAASRAAKKLALCYMCEICKDRSPCAPLHQSQYFYLASRSWRLHTWSYVLPLTLAIQGFKNLLFFKLSLLLNELRVLSSIPVLPFVCDSPTTRISCLNLTTIAQSPRSIIIKYSVHVSSDG